MSEIDEDIRDGIDRLFSRISRMTDEEVLLLRATWDEGDATERKSAWRSVRAAVEATGRQKLLDEAGTRFAAWGTSDDLIGYWGVANLPSHGSGMAREAVRREALPPVMDAIGATVAFDRLDPREMELLLAPLSSVEGK
jgi:hypothetical protein